MAPAFLARRPLLVGVVHLQPLPGSPRHAGPFERVIARALADARALVQGGVGALLVENLGDAPYYPEAVPPETVAGLALAARALAEAHPRVPLGINVLRNDARAAIALAGVCGLAFVRINVHTGAAVTDQGLVQGRAHESLRERARLAPRAAILADAHVKHATPLSRETLGEAVADLVKRGLADGVIVSGRATGQPPSARALAEARAAAPRTPLLIGSGLDTNNAGELLAHADGAIVGTALKRGGRIEEPVDAARVRALSALCAKLGRRKGA